jgi:hypothetical protein
MTQLVALAPTFATTREALRALACYVIAPARKGRTGRIGLVPFGDGFATPPLEGDVRLAVSGAELCWAPGDRAAITTLREASAFAGVELSPDPGVGHDLPPYEPDARLDVDAEASRALGAWYAFGARVLAEVPADGVDVSEATLWPEHFDLAVVAELAGGAKVNIGASPGDSGHDEPYVYVGPHDLSGLGGDYWNAPFGALLGYADLRAAPDLIAAAVDFVTTGLARLQARA